MKRVSQNKMGSTHNIPGGAIETYQDYDGRWYARAFQDGEYVTDKIYGRTEEDAIEKCKDDLRQWGQQIAHVRKRSDYSQNYMGVSPAKRTKRAHHRATADEGAEWGYIFIDTNNFGEDGASLVTNDGRAFFCPCDVPYGLGRGDEFEVTNDDAARYGLDKAADDGVSDPALAAEAIEEYLYDHVIAPNYASRDKRRTKRAASNRRKNMRKRAQDFWAILDDISVEMESAENMEDARIIVEDYLRNQSDNDIDALYDQYGVSNGSYRKLIEAIATDMYDNYGIHEWSRKTTAQDRRTRPARASKKKAYRNMASRTTRMKRRAQQEFDDLVESDEGSDMVSQDPRPESNEGERNVRNETDNANEVNARRFVGSGAIDWWPTDKDTLFAELDGGSTVEIEELANGRWYYEVRDAYGNRLESRECASWKEAVSIFERNYEMFPSVYRSASSRRAMMRARKRAMMNRKTAEYKDERHPADCDCPECEEKREHDDEREARRNVLRRKNMGKCAQTAWYEYPINLPRDIYMWDEVSSYATDKYNGVIRTYEYVDGNGGKFTVYDMSGSREYSAKFSGSSSYYPSSKRYSDTFEDIVSDLEADANLKISIDLDRGTEFSARRKALARARRRAAMSRRRFAQDSDADEANTVDVEDDTDSTEDEDEDEREDAAEELAEEQVEAGIAKGDPARLAKAYARKYSTNEMRLAAAQLRAANAKKKAARKQPKGGVRVTKRAANIGGQHVARRDDGMDSSCLFA